jgi:hypothetical protein
MGMIFAKETWISTANGSYLLAENRNPASHILKILAFPFASVLMLITGLVIWPTIVLRRPKTRGYGISTADRQRYQEKSLAP